MERGLPTLERSDLDTLIVDGEVDVPANAAELTVDPERLLPVIAINAGQVALAGNCPDTNYCVWHGCKGACK